MSIAGYLLLKTSFEQIEEDVRRALAIRRSRLTVDLESLIIQLVVPIDHTVYHDLDDDLYDGPLRRGLKYWVPDDSGNLQPDTDVDSSDSLPVGDSCQKNASPVMVFDHHDHRATYLHDILGKNAFPTEMDTSARDDDGRYYKGPGQLEFVYR